jgi:hypothetical protein
MKTNNPLVILLTLWLALLSVPTPAQQSGTSTSAHTHHARHHSKHAAKRTVAKKSIRVWVNTNSGVYHYPGMRWYGRTKSGEFMTEDEARKRGYRPTENGQ